MRRAIEEVSGSPGLCSKYNQGKLGGNERASGLTDQIDGRSRHFVLLFLVRPRLPIYPYIRDHVTTELVSLLPV